MPGLLHLNKFADEGARQTADVAQVSGLKQFYSSTYKCPDWCALKITLRRAPGRRLTWHR